MNLNNMKIGTQLRLSLGAVMLMVMVLGAMAWVQADSLWEQTKGLYEHPLQVRRALGELRSDILSIRLELRDLTLVKSEQDRQTLIQNISEYSANANRQFDNIYKSYLGPRADIDVARSDFVRWKALVDENIRLIQSGRNLEVIKNLRNNAVITTQRQQLIDSIDKISDFAFKRGNRFYNEARQENQDLKTRLGLILTTILTLLLVIGYLLMKGIREPLKELELAAGQFRDGNLDARSRYVSANEFGVLSDSFNLLAATIQADFSVKESSARISRILLQEEELRPFCRELLSALLRHTGSQVGAIYLLNGRKTDFEHFESIGLSAARRESFSASAREGEFGMALASQRIQHVRDIPEESRFGFATVNGDLLPREIITMPILSEQEVVAMVSLSSVKPYDDVALKLLEDVWPVMTARLNGVLVLKKIRDFSERLEHQNRELDAQKREITAQKDELSEQNVELEMQKAQLDEANRLKSSFLSNMSHELRTPLNSVIALSGVLNRRLANVIPEEEYSYLEVIERNGRNLLELINDILDLSRIEAGREEISLSRFSVRALAAEIVAMIEPQARQKDILLLNSVDPELGYIRSDYAKCRHILQNLVSNAVKFTEEGSVSITAEIRDGRIRIAVSDTGIGISADHIEHIFDEFRQADESTTKKYGGTGLGLSIARKYAFMLQGNITVESTLGAGSEFTLSLPLRIDVPDGAGHPAETNEFHAPVQYADVPDAVKGHGRRILVVEDNDSAIIQLKEILVEQGYQVLVARNGKEALEQIEGGLPDAMILDLMMPEVDGFDVLRAIRSVEKTAHIPVLILTAKHVSKAELSFLTGNHIHQLIQKGDVNRVALLAAVGRMVMPAGETRQPRPRAADRRPITGRPNILVVEDNRDNLKTIRALLQESSNVMEAEDGEAGLEIARTRKPDLILMDISMPKLDGYKALDAIRNDESIGHIPVIAVTASAMSGNREEILAHGFDGYISKPVDWRELEEMISEKLRGE